MGVVPINPLGLPIFNTLVLLRSGAFVTWSHHLMLNKKNFFYSLLISVFLAFIFLVAQYKEYSWASFSISDGIFGSCFYFGTGFHGIHVILGIFGLIFNLYRCFLGEFSVYQHLSFEFSIIYWQFVDVVWLFLYVIMYWWSY